jgi:hypothetical protein
MSNMTATLTSVIDQFIQSTTDQSINWEHKPAAGKWSNKEIIGHLCDSAQINLQRFIRCTYEENFKLTYEQDEWVSVQHYQKMNMADLLQLWKLLNLQIARVLDNYPADRWQAQCDNNKNGISLHTVEWLSQDYLEHLQHHLKQIRLPELLN